ncbi:serine hydrolase domain-containing protein [Kaarinaea lacus]
MKALITVLFMFIVAGLALIGCSDEHNADRKPTNPKGTMTDRQLEQILAQSYEGDRTGVCVAAAFIQGEAVSRATVCADPEQHRLEGDAVALEIGSITKTMTAAVLASLIVEGQLNLDDSLEMHLPLTANVPNFEGQPILLKHLVTHTSGLPNIPDALAYDPDNPYADFTETQIADALGSITLDRKPGTQFEYSNYGFMLLSYVLVHTTGTDFETLMRERIFNPLSMPHTYISEAPAGTTAAIGHVANFGGEPTNAWDFPINLSGSGGVKATLDDMILYAQAQLGIGDPRVVNTLMVTQELVDLGSDYPAEETQMGMAWGIATLSDRTILAHSGGTGGFSSYLIFEPETKRAVVILTDANQGLGMEELAVHLLYPDEYERPQPRRVVVPDQDLLQALQGNYRIAELELEVTLSYSEQTLIGTIAEESEEFGFDNYGVFFPRTLNYGLLVPFVDETGKQTFAWIDDRVFIAERLDP